MTTRAPAPRTWYEKFRDAFRGVRTGMRGQSSFQVHLGVTVVVIIAAALLRCTLWEWCILCSVSVACLPPK